MKKQEIQNYTPLEIEIVEVNIEKGYAGSEQGEIPKAFDFN